MVFHFFYTSLPIIRFLLFLKSVDRLVYPRENRESLSTKHYMLTTNLSRILQFVNLSLSYPVNWITGKLLNYINLFLVFVFS